MPHATQATETSRSAPDGQAAVHAMMAAVADMGLSKADQAAVQLALSTAYWHGLTDGRAGRKAAA